LTGAARVTLAALLSAGFVAVSAIPAGAHTALEASSPKADGKLDVAPSQVLLDFTEPIRKSLSRVVVLGPDGRRYESGPPQVGGDKLIQALKPLGPTGRYQVEFRVVASDGHPLVNEMRFTLTKPGPAAGGSEATTARFLPIVAVKENPNGPSDAPSWAPLAAAAAAVIIAAGAVWFGRRVTHGLD
jgi:methionine-rich copper-binding protein CopC